MPAKVTNRFGDSPVSDIDYSRRRVTRNSFQDGQFMDWVDLSKMGTDPRSAKMNVMKNKFLRQEDITLDTALLGKAEGGAQGTTDTYLTNDALIGYDGATAVTDGFTYEKFLGALETFGSNNVDIELYNPVFKLSWKQWQDIMKEDEFINFDYTAARPIDGGLSNIYSYMGARFCVSNILPYFNSTTADLSSDGATDDGNLNIADSDIDSATGTWSDSGGSATRAVYAFVQDAALLEINPDITTKVSERADKSFNFYAYMKAEFGAVRMEEEKVVVLPCLES